MSSGVLSSETDVPPVVEVERPITPSSTDLRSSSLSLPSSPTLAKDEAPEEQMPSVTKKRSHEEMSVDADAMYDSSVTMTGDPAIKESDSSQPVLPIEMPPPSAPKSNMPPPSQKPPPSGQQSFDHKKPFDRAANTELPNHDDTDQSREHTSETVDDEAEYSSSSSVSGEPQDQIEEFDWDGLHARYHDKIKAMNAAEENILHEFNHLCDYFGIWAQAGSHQEVERSFKRLKTQTMLVQHREDELEQKRLHYIKVVDAFKSALQLLGN